MSAPAASLIPRDSLAEEAASLAVGAAVTLGLFLGLAHFEHGTRPPEPEIEDLRAVTLLPEPPPPPPVPQTSAEPAEAALAVTGLEVGAEDSPVKIAVSPLEFDLPPLPQAAPLEIRPAQVHATFRPSLDLSSDTQRVYQEADVDKIPKAIDRSLQMVPRHVRRDAAQLAVVLLFLIEKDGRASSVRVIKSSGNPAFDEIAARSVKEDWTFSPAVKRGKPVRCLVQQPVRFKWNQGSVLEAN